MTNKVTLELDKNIGCIFINYVAMTPDGAVMGSRMIDTKDILVADKTGEPVAIEVPKIKEGE